MDDESSFQRALDDAPDNWSLRRVYADWLDERGRGGKAACQRWMVERRRSPAFVFRLSWDWWCKQPDSPWQGAHVPECCFLEPTLYERLSGSATRSGWSQGVSYCEYPTRAAAERALGETLTATGERR